MLLLSVFISPPDVCVCNYYTIQEVPQIPIGADAPVGQEEPIEPVFPGQLLETLPSYNRSEFQRACYAIKAEPCNCSFTACTVSQKIRA